MKRIYKEKYNQILKDYFNIADKTVSILKEYFNYNFISNSPNDLISGIYEIKKIKKIRKKLMNDFNKEFCLLIENIIDNFKEEDLNNLILDNYAIMQLFLCIVFLPYIKKEKTDIEEVVYYIFTPLIYKIKKEYGNDFYNILKMLNIFNEEIIKKNKPEINDIILNASSLIKNIYPEKFNDTINIFCLNNFKQIKKYNVDFEQIKPKEKKNFQKIFNNIYKTLYVFKRIIKNNITTRYDFFNEFRGLNEKEYLSTINQFLKNLRLRELNNLYDDSEDNYLLKEKISYLINENEKKKEENKNLIIDLNKQINENTELKQQIINLKEEIKKKDIELINLIKKNENKTNNLYSKNNEIKVLKDSCEILSNQLIDSNQKLLDAQDLIKYYHHRDSCKRIENYFYNIISPDNRKEIENELKSKDRKKKRIDLIIEKISEEYHKYLTDLVQKGIDLVSILKDINYFRKKINNEIHDKYKTNKESLINTLTKYYNNKINFTNPLNYMYNNFEKFVEYSFDPDYKLNIDLYNAFELRRKE